MRSRFGWLLALVASVVLAGCGGGGGGDDATDFANAPGLSLNASRASFTMLEGTPPPAGQNINIRVTAGDAQKLIVGTPPGVALPTWLDVQLSGSISNAVMTLLPRAGVPTGNYSVTLRVLIGRANDSLIAYREVLVTLRVDAALAPGVQSLAPNGVTGASPARDTLSIVAPGLNWTATSSAPWLQLSANAGTGNTSLAVSFLSSGLQPGTYTTEIVLTGSNGVVQRIPVTFTVAEPVLTLGTGSVLLGGPDGHDLAPKSLPLTLNTGTNGYGWSVTGVPVWLTLNANAGVVDGTGQSLTFTPVIGSAPIGVSNATLHFSTTINGTVRTLDVPVTLNRDAHRLVAEANGVALVSTPTISRLSRTLTIRSSLDQTADWVASADVPWLNVVTPSGSAGGSLTLQANPAGLAANQLHLGTVNVVSVPGVIAERIRVGLWVGSADPAARISVANGMDGGSKIVADPVRPYVYLQTNTPSPAVVVYNAYTGTQVQRVPFASRIGIMAVASDGSTLYVHDEGNARIQTIDLNTFQLGPVMGITSLPNGRDSMAYVRVRGVPLLLSPWGTFTTDGAMLTQPVLSPVVDARSTATPDGKRLYVYHGNFLPATVEKFTLDYSSLAPTSLAIAKVGETRDTWGGGVGEDLAYSSATDTLHVSNNVGIDARLRGSDLSLIDSLFLSPFRFVLQIEAASDGSVFYALDPASGSNNLVMVTPAGGVVPRGATGPIAFMPGLAITGDVGVAAVLGYVPAPAERMELIMVRVAP